MYKYGVWNALWACKSTKNSTFDDANNVYVKWWWFVESARDQRMLLLFVLQMLNKDA